MKRNIILRFCNFGILSIPLILFLAYQIINQGVPVEDGGDHYRITYLIYQAFQKGLKHGINFIFHTDGKPILFSAFAAPFIFLTNENIRWSVILFLFSIECITLYAYYMLFRIKISPLFSALLATTIVTTPFIFSIHTQFMPEIMWHMWFVLFLNALFRSQSLTNAKMSFWAGLLLSLTILARPIESIILFAPGFCLYFYYLYTEKVLPSTLKIIYIVFINILPITICFATNFFHYNEIIGRISIWAFCIIFTWEVYQQSQYKENKQAKLFIFLIPISLLTSIWLLNYGFNLWNWAINNSVGQDAVINDQINLHKNIIKIFYEIIQFYGKLAIFGLLTLSVASLFLDRSKKLDIKNTSVGLIVLILTILPMLWVYTHTGISDVRRIFLGMVLLIIFAAFFAFRKFDKINLFNLSILILILSTQVFSIIFTINPNPNLIKINATINNLFGPFKYAIPQSEPSEDKKIIEIINSLDITNTKIAVYSLSMFNNHMSYQIESLNNLSHNINKNLTFNNRISYQVESLRYFTLNMNKNLTFGSMWGYAKDEPYSMTIKRLLANDYKYILLENLDDSIMEPYLREQLSSHTYFIKKLLAKIKKNNECHIGHLKFIKKFNIANNEQYLFEIQDDTNLFAMK